MGVGNLVAGAVKNLLISGAGFAGAFGAAFYYDQNIGCLRRVSGTSMTPTLNRQYQTAGNYETARSDPARYHSEWVYFKRDIKNLERGDIIFLTHPKKRDNLTKRVVGVEGDTITPFSVGSKEKSPIVVAPGEVWVESDGGPGYLGSSVFGPVPLECVQGIGVFMIASRPNDNFLMLERDIPAHVEPRLVIGSKTISSNETELKQNSEAVLN